MKKFFRTLFVIDDILLFPCALCTVWNFVSRFADIGSIWQHWFLGLSLPVVFLNCFLYFPYILSAAAIVGYLWALRKDGFPRKEMMLFIALLAVCALGLISLDAVFQAAMGV